MHYEMLSRALAYTSCLCTVSLFATSMAIAAVNVGKIKPPLSCGKAACAAVAVKAAKPQQYGGLTSKAHVEAVANVLWSKKI
jgi:hypothetical protein